MQKDASLQHGNVKWVGDASLAQALLVKKHRLFTTGEDAATRQFFWLFHNTGSLDRDIEKFEKRRLQIDARLYAVYLTGKIYGESRE